ncbi:glycosyltransferase [Thauera sp. AutoDN2]|uniref:glycosyltransferase n=1 Tax=Thauera sp. AutoDN2 TaxID=3416051 RepID=UPI003F4C46DB
MKSLLMIAFHFPPIQGSSGIQRTLGFARHLPEFGWQPIVLTAHPRAYPSTTNDLADSLPPELQVIRAQAWDASRHFAIRGRYPAALARPDRWASWWFGAVPAGMSAIHQLKPHALWSTYPIATAHRIGATLQARSGLPWVADFRDPMAQDDYPPDPVTRRHYADLDQRTVTQASRTFLSTPTAVADYRRRYPQQAHRIDLLENAFDEGAFQQAETSHEAIAGPLAPGKRTLLHSGIVYPSERDPSHLFEALARLQQTRPQVYDGLQIRFRAPVHDTLLKHLATKHGVQQAVQILPALGYRDALAEMLRADGLLILQASNCNAQIPAKLYEYFRAQRPIISLTDPAGDTAARCRAAGIETDAPLDDVTAIASRLEQFVTGTLPRSIAPAVNIAQASRRARAQQLAKALDAL